MTVRPALNRVWASDAPPSNVQDPDLFGSMDKVSRGWGAEIPPFQWFNWLFHRTDITKLALAERGVFSWGKEISYKKGALAYNDEDSQIYTALKANIDQIPSDLSNGCWAVSAVNLTVKDYEDLMQRLDDHLKSTSNPHKVTAAQINAYTKAEIDALLKGTSDAISDHEKDTSNPHEVTALQAGAVPVTGGEYTGAVTFKAEATFFGLGDEKLASVTNSGGKFGLKQDKAMVGIKTDDGLPYYWPDVAQAGSLLLDASKFEELKLQHEPDYAVPEPDFYMPLTCDTNIYNGCGYTEYSRSSSLIREDRLGNEVTYADDQPAFDMDGYFASEGSILAVYNQLLTGLNWTVSVRLTESIGGTVLCNQTERFYIRVTTSGLEVKYGNNIKSVDIVVSGDFAVTLVSDGAIAALYVDGIEVATLNSFTEDFGDTYYVGNNSSGNLDLGASLKGLKVWNYSLTSKQVSNI